MTLKTWLTSALVRNFPRTPAPRRPQPLALDLARNERFGFQLAARNECPDLGAGAPATVRLEVVPPAGWTARIRTVEAVPVRHLNTGTPADEVDGAENYPGYVPDLLRDGNELLVAPNETRSFYVNLLPGRNVRTGRQAVKLSLRNPEGKVLATHRVELAIHDVTIRPRRDFPVTNWFYADSLIDWYRTDLFDKRFWAILPAYFRNMTEHGQDTIYVPVFTPPLDGVKRPSQLLRIRKAGKNRYRFDWRDVKQYVKLAKQAGFTYFEWSHLFTQWGCANALRIYEGQGRDEKLLWKPETGATSPTYRAFLGQFLPELEKFCRAEKILDRSFFHVSDEPHGEVHRANYIKARELLKELAPWMKVMDALTEIEYGREQLTDMPIPSIKTALDFHREGLTSWCYYCCGPRGQYLNRLLDTPLAKIRMNGWLFYRWPFKGFLHWGYNYWQRSQTRELIDPFTLQDGGKWPGWAYGDTFLVYPGENGPLDSLRWEAFADSLQEYALLQTLGLDRESKLLAPLQSFADFPKSADWIFRTKRELLKRGAKAR